jgi:hypothetical protein
MTATAREDFFTLIHKGQRRELFAVTTSAGTIDWDDPQAAAEFGSAWEQLRRMLKIHGKHEDKHFFPLIAGTAPQVTAGVNATHGELEEALAKLTGMIGAAVAALAQSAGLAVRPCKTMPAPRPPWTACATSDTCQVAEPQSYLFVPLPGGQARACSA